MAAMTDSHEAGASSVDVRPPSTQAGEVKPFLDHLEDLRWTIIKISLVIAVAAILCFAFAPQLLGLIIQPLQRVVEDPRPFLRVLEVTGGFTVTIKIAVMAGLVLASPFVLYFLAQFILPALTTQERRMLRPVFASATLLFLAGCALAYFVVLPLALGFFIAYNERLGISSEWTLQSYVGFVTMMLIAFGVCFELPLVVLVLARLGIVTQEFLRQKRPLFLVMILVVAAVLTPPDLISQVLLAVPMILLFEACIWIAGWMERRAAQA
jgi:sec-independent protein translocase protein TatC